MQYHPPAHRQAGEAKGNAWEKRGKESESESAYNQTGSHHRKQHEMPSRNKWPLLSLPASSYEKGCTCLSQYNCECSQWQQGKGGWAPPPYQTYERNQWTDPPTKSAACHPQCTPVELQRARTKRHHIPPFAPAPISIQLYPHDLRYHPTSKSSSWPQRMNQVRGSSPDISSSPSCPPPSKAVIHQPLINTTKEPWMSLGGKEAHDERAVKRD